MEGHEAFSDTGRWCIIDKVTLGWDLFTRIWSIGNVHDGRVDLSFELSVRRLSSFSSMLARLR